jgi:hypothetical protein
METTINKLRQLIANTEKDYRHQILRLNEAGTITYVKEVSGGAEEAMSEPTSYMAEMDTTLSIIDKLVRAKGALADLNARTTIDVEGAAMSIAGAIAALQAKRQLLSVIENHMQYNKASKRRIDKPNTPAYWEIVRLNYDQRELRALRDRLRDEIDSIEARVDEANNRKISLEL